jgi:hypothetical protein
MDKDEQMRLASRYEQLEREREAIKQRVNEQGAQRIRAQRDALAWLIAEASRGANTISEPVRSCLIELSEELKVRRDQLETENPWIRRNP